MKLEDQVTSLELSKRLKELGVKQESLFYYVGEDLIYGISKSLREQRIISAFTASEIFALLPSYLDLTKEEGYYDYFIHQCIDEQHQIAYDSTPYFSSTSLSNCAAEVLIHLIENNLMEIK